MTSINYRQWQSQDHRDEPRDQQRDLDGVALPGSYWASIGPDSRHTPDGWSWTVMDFDRDNAEVASGFTDTEEFAKAAVEAWRAGHTAVVMLEPFATMSDVDQVLHLVYDHGFDGEYGYTREAQDDFEGNDDGEVTLTSNVEVIEMFTAWLREQRVGYHAEDHANYGAGGGFWSEGPHDHEPAA